MSFSHKKHRKLKNVLSLCASSFVAAKLLLERFVVTHFLKLLLIFTTALAVWSKIVPAILDQFLAQLLALRMTITLKCKYGKQ
jgi:hypothetical protein